MTAQLCKENTGGVSRYNLEFVKDGSRKQFEEAASLNYFCDRDLNVRKYTDATILPYNKDLSFPGGVSDESGQMMKGTSFSAIRNASAPISDGSRTKMRRSAIFLGSWPNVYGHFITDNIKKLWIFFDARYTGLIDECDLIYNVEDAKPLSKHMNEVLTSLLGEEQLVSRMHRIDTPTAYDAVYIPDDSLAIIPDNTFRCYTKQYKLMVDAIVSSCLKKCPDTVSYEKIYLSRTKIHDRKDIGEDRVERLFRENGYKVVFPETLPFAEQVKMLHSCKSLSCTVGSVSHSALFCNDGVELILLNKADYANDYQFFIDEMRNLDVTYIDVNCTLNRNRPWLGPFFLCITPELSSFFGVKYKYVKLLDYRWYVYLYRCLRKSVARRLLRLLQNQR